MTCSLAAVTARFWNQGKRTYAAALRGLCWHQDKFYLVRYPLLFALQSFEGLAVATALDIACMKISALAGRGSRRDFVDVYVAAQQYGLQHPLNLFQRKFAQAKYSSIHLRKALIYFADAEQESMPDMLVPICWKQIKDFFYREVPNLQLL